MISFNIDSFPSSVLYIKGQELTKDIFTEGEYENLEKFANILEDISKEVVNPLSIINISSDERGSVNAVYGPVFGLSVSGEKTLSLYCNKKEYPVDFTEDKGCFLGTHQITSLVGKEITFTNKEEQEIKLLTCNGLIDKYQIPFAMNKQNPFSINDQVLFLSSFMSGRGESYQKFLDYIAIPSMGGNKIKAKDLKVGVYVVTDSEERNDKYGRGYNLTLKNIKTKEQHEVFSCSYFKTKFPVYKAASLRKSTPLYLLVDKPKTINAKLSFNGSFSFDPADYLDTVNM
jgi:hypothetical protein